MSGRAPRNSSLPLARSRPLLRPRLEIVQDGRSILSLSTSAGSSQVDLLAVPPLLLLLPLLSPAEGSVSFSRPLTYVLRHSRLNPQTHTHTQTSAGPASSRPYLSAQHDEWVTTSQSAARWCVEEGSQGTTSTKPQHRGGQDSDGVVCDPDSQATRQQPSERQQRQAQRPGVTYSAPRTAALTRDRTSCGGKRAGRRIRSAARAPRSRPGSGRAGRAPLRGRGRRTSSRALGGSA